MEIGDNSAPVGSSQRTVGKAMKAVENRSQHLARRLTGNHKMWHVCGKLSTSKGDAMAIAGELERTSGRDELARLSLRAAVEFDKLARGKSADHSIIADFAECLKVGAGTPSSVQTRYLHNHRAISAYNRAWRRVYSSTTENAEELTRQIYGKLDEILQFVAAQKRPGVASANGESAEKLKRFCLSLHQELLGQEFSRQRVRRFSERASSGMDEFRLAKRKIAQFKDEIARVRTSDFHHPGAKLALTKIDDVFNAILSDIDALPVDASPDVRQAHCSSLNATVDRFHKIVGFILRSTNARNPFEIYDPLLWTVKKLFDENTVLILSSEWEFSPFTNPAILGRFADCIFVGLPVMEASNSLIIPLVGHELGHSVSGFFHLSSQFAPSKETDLADMFTKTWDEFTTYFKISSTDEMRERLILADWGSIPLEWMERQCEEIFCDLLGVKIFGMGYLYAFEYLACPNIGPTDLEAYPAMDARAEYLRDAVILLSAKDRLQASDSTTSAGESRNGWPTLEAYADRFIERIDFAEEGPRVQLATEDRYLLQVAHKACRTLIPDLMKEANEICDRKELPVPTFEASRNAMERFRVGIPAIAHMADVVNAGWLAYLEQDFWCNKSGWQRKRFEFINELVFKSLDVTEFEARTKNAAEIR